MFVVVVNPDKGEAIFLERLFDVRKISKGTHGVVLVEIQGKTIFLLRAVCCRKSENGWDSDKRESEIWYFEIPLLRKSYTFVIESFSGVFWWKISWYYAINVQFQEKSISFENCKSK